MFEFTRPASLSIVLVMSVVLNTLLTALKNLLSLFHRRTCASRMTVFGPPAQGNTSSQNSTLQSCILGVQVARKLCHMPVCCKNLLLSLLLSLCSYSGCAGNAVAYAVIRMCSCNSCFHILHLILSRSRASTCCLVLSALQSTADKKIS